MHPSWKRGEAWGFEREDVGKDERVDSSCLRFDKADDMEDSRAISLFTLASCQNNWISVSPRQRGKTWSSPTVRRRKPGDEKWDEARRERNERSCVWAEGKKKNRTVIVFNDGIRVDCTYWDISQASQEHGAWNETRGTMLLELAKMFAWNVAEGRLKCKQNTVEESKGSGGRRSSRRKQNVIVLSSFVRGWL